MKTLSHFVFTIIFMLLTNCMPPAFYSKPDKCQSLEKTFGDTISGWWQPLSIKMELYNRNDVAAFIDSVPMDTVIKAQNAKGALLLFTKDSLFEYMIFDTCVNSYLHQISFTGHHIYFSTTPLLLSNQAQGYAKEDTLHLKDGFLYSTIVVYFDSL